MLIVLFLTSSRSSRPRHATLILRPFHDFFTHCYESSCHVLSRCLLCIHSSFASSLILALTAPLIFLSCRASLLPLPVYACCEFRRVSTFLFCYTYSSFCCQWYFTLHSCMVVRPHDLQNVLVAWHPGRLHFLLVFWVLGSLYAFSANPSQL